MSAHKYFLKAERFTSLCRLARSHLRSANIEIGDLQKAIDTIQATMPQTELVWFRKSTVDDEPSMHVENGTIGILELLIRERQYEALVAIAEAMKEVRSLAFAEIWPQYSQYFDFTESRGDHNGKKVLRPYTIHDIAVQMSYRYHDNSNWMMEEPEARMFVAEHWESLDATLERMEDGIFALMDHPSFDIEEWEVSDVVDSALYRSELKGNGNSRHNSAYSDSAYSAFFDLFDTVGDSGNSATSDFPPSSWSTPTPAHIQAFPGTSAPFSQGGSWAFQVSGAIPNPGTELAESRETRQQRRRRDMDERLNFFRSLAADKIRDLATGQQICAKTEEPEFYDSEDSDEYKQYYPEEEKSPDMDDIDIDDDFILWKPRSVKRSRKTVSNRQSDALNSHARGNPRTHKSRYVQLGKKVSPSYLGKKANPHYLRIIGR
ncbi:hypothetical protein EV356DRAFT_515051 [Viridothelium virens]|uniref:Uncharacterized protein n=1 Tax=Viridothelium virens TaxID=1048519 RepID=A0A6A6H9H7_VIRVR|nr:hypothetical protein EV356DRAFT_515051 [Viridothelium virens]